MRIKFAHLRDQGINFAIFNADSNCGTNSGRVAVLAKLTARARMSGLAVEKSALAFMENGRMTFFGTPDLVNYLSSRGVSCWTHSLDA